MAVPTEALALPSGTQQHAAFTWVRSSNRSGAMILQVLSSSPQHGSGGVEAGGSGAGLAPGRGLAQLAHQKLLAPRAHGRARGEGGRHSRAIHVPYLRAERACASAVALRRGAAGSRALLAELTWGKGLAALPYAETLTSCTGQGVKREQGLISQTESVSAS
jgi:hypothetical protein